MTISYAELAAEIAKMTEEQQNAPIAFYDRDEDEFYTLELMFASPDEDVVEPNSPCFVIMEEDDEED